METLDAFKTARHTKANAAGLKAERPNIRYVPKGSFKSVDTLMEIVTTLFGAEPSLPQANAQALPAD